MKKKYECAVFKRCQGQCCGTCPRRYERRPMDGFHRPVPCINACTCYHEGCTHLLISVDVEEGHEAQEEV